MSTWTVHWRTLSLVNVAYCSQYFCRSSEWFPGARVMFSPPGHVSKKGFFGIDGLRIFLLAKVFDTLVRKLTIKCAADTLSEALTGLRCLYGDV